MHRLIPIFLLLAAVLRAQSPVSPPAYTYETVSIHASDPNQTGAHIGPGPGGGLTTRNTSVKDLIEVGWNIPEYRIAGLPGWASSEHFDVTFTPDKQETPFTDGMKSAEFAAVLHRQAQRIQAVLRDRFGLVAHTEDREMSVYSMTVSKGGSKLKPSTSPMSDNISGRSVIATGFPMKSFADDLAEILGRPVSDDTGLEGAYDIKLTWTPDVATPNSPQPDRSMAGPSVFTAITEQLGLKLASKKGTVPVYVVDKVVQPSAN